MNASPDLPEVPQPRSPFDPDRLHRLEIAADSAYAITRQLHDRLDELRTERAKFAASIHLAEYPPAEGVHRPGAASPADYDHLAFVEEQIRAVEIEIKAHHEKAAPLRELAQRCVEWARRRSWRGNNAIGIPERPASETLPPVPLQFDGTMPLTHSAPPPSAQAAAHGSGFGSLLSKAGAAAARLTGGPHGRR